jgi:acyl carrier protein
VRTEATVLAEIGDLIRKVLDGYDLDAVPITRETSFQRDLAFESIDIVVLGTRLTEQYGPAINFPAYLATLTIQQIIALRVGDLVDYVLPLLPAVPAVSLPVLPDGD